MYAHTFNSYASFAHDMLILKGAKCKKKWQIGGSISLELSATAANFSRVELVSSVSCNLVVQTGNVIMRLGLVSIYLGHIVHRHLPHNVRYVSSSHSVDNSVNCLFCFI